MESTVTKMVSRRPLVVFSRSTCGMCHGIISFFRNFGANVVVHELDEIQTGQEIEQSLSSLGYNALPVVFIGGELVGGTNEVTSLHLERSLVPMLKRAGAIHL